MDRPLGLFERLPKWLLCLPLVVQWLLLALRYRSLTLPTALNPGIETGGLVGESKLASLVLLQLAEPGLVALAIGIDSDDDPATCRRQSGLDYPLIAKPDMGWCGYGVRRVASDSDLAAYAAAFPAGNRFLLQRFVDGPHEAGIAYVRHPDAASGRLAAITLRHGPEVCGDGRSTLRTLIRTSPWAGRVRRYEAALGADALAGVPAPGERVRLTVVASLRVGGRYEDVTELATPALAAAVERLAQALGSFHFGRFDVRFESVAALQAGHFRVIEVNGAGSEAIQFWDSRVGLRAAFTGVFAKQRQLFAVAAAMRARGARPVGPARLARDWLRQQRLISRYPASN